MHQTPYKKAHNCDKKNLSGTPSSFNTVQGTHIVNILYSCNITIHMDNLILKTVLFQIIPICYHHSYQIAHHAIISHKLTFFSFIQDGESKLVSCSNLSTRYQFTIRPPSILCIIRKGKGDNTTLSQKIRVFHT